VVEGISALVFALLLSSFIAWIPVSALAGILIVVGLRMIDREPMRFIQSSATVFDFGVVVAVVVVALTIGLIAASGVGVAMAIILFVREQIGGSVVRHKFYVNQMSSNWHRPESETRILAQKGDQAVIFELQGSLFFGTTQQLLRRPRSGTPLAQVRHPRPEARPIHRRHRRPHAQPDARRAGRTRRPAAALQPAREPAERPQPARQSRPGHRLG
jgi:MFS superfamily sulfate permease-like transporter